MSNNKNQSSFGDFLCAELKANISELNMNRELQREIERRHIDLPVADETVWPKTIDASRTLPPARSRWFDRNIDLPSSLYGW